MVSPNLPNFPAVEVERLTVRFGDFTAVDDISFSVSRGEIFGFLGANGAGKTTTIRALCGLLVPTEGRIVVAGSSDVRTIKGRVGYMSQRFTLYDDLTAEENVLFAGRLRRMEDRRIRERFRELADFAGFHSPPNTLVRDLPAGIKQKLALSVCLLHDPSVIFLDEPTAGVAPDARESFWQLIRRATSAGKTVFVTTHYMDEAERCGRVALMRDGRIIALDSPEGLKRAAFPEPFFELTAPAEAPEDWPARVRAVPGVHSLSPHGLRYHLAAAAGARWEDALPAGTIRKAVPPSLEDVFLRLVEGPS